MKKCIFWLFLQLAFSSPNLFAQNINPTPTAVSKILSSASSETNEVGSLSVSIGFVHTLLTPLSADDKTTNSVLRDTVVTSQALTAMALNSAAKPYQDYPNNFGQNQSEIKAAVAVYPNPFINRVTLSFDDTFIDVDSDYNYALLNSRGESIDAGPLLAGEKEIGMSNMPSGIYFLVLSQHNQHIETFKLLKN